MGRRFRLFQSSRFANENNSQAPPRRLSSKRVDVEGAQRKAYLALARPGEGSGAAFHEVGLENGAGVKAHVSVADVPRQFAVDGRN